MALDLKGIIPPVVTVFDNEENIDFEGFKSIINHLIDHGVYGIFTCGGQGEGFSLTNDEKLRLLDTCLDTVNGRVPVLMGTGAITTHGTVEMTRLAREHGADAATIITPYFISPTQDELYAHYLAVLEAVDIPILIYNNPWRTHLNLLPETAARLREASKNLVGIKDSSGDMGLTHKYKRLCGDDFKVFVGRDQLIYAALVTGMDGAVAATSNAAVNIVVGIYNEFIAGNLEIAKAYQDTLVPLREFFSQGTFPVVVKEAMTLQGLPAGPCRMPVGPLSDEKRAELKEIIIEMGLLGK